MRNRLRSTTAPTSAIAATVASSFVVTVIAMSGCAGHVAPVAAPPLAIDAPAALPWAGTTVVLRADQVHRLSPVLWSATPNTLAWVSPDGALTFLEPGDVAVRATDGTREGTRAFAVRANTAAQVVMQERVVARAAVGDTVRIKGHVYDAEGARVPDAPVAYALVVRGDEQPGATVGADGRFVASEPGVYTVLAECGRVSGRTIVIVEGPEERAARELVALRALRTAEVAGATEPRAAIATSMGGPPQVQVGADSAAVYHPDRATRDDSTRRTHAVAAVRVAAERTTRVTIDDFDAVPYDGTTQTLSARVWVGDAHDPDTTARPMWVSSDPERAYVMQSGRVVFLAPGWVTLTASHGGVTATRRFNVRWLPATRLALRPSTADVRVGQPVRFREDVWTPGGIPMADARVNYAIIAHGVQGAVPATLTERRVFTASQPGVYTVIAEVGGVADKFTLLVRDAAVAAR